VFALLGLLSDSKAKEGLFMTVDYTWTKEELMRQVAEKLIELPQPLAFLCDAVGYWRGSSYAGPSWIPDYSQKDYAMLDPWALDGSAFNPAHNLPFRRWPSEDGAQLVVDGICFSPVVWTAPCFSDTEQIDHTMSQLFILLQHFKPNVDELAKLSILSRTITGGRDSYGSRDRNISNYARDFADFLLKWQQCFDVNPKFFIQENQELATSGQYSRFMDVATVVCGRRSLFVTASGHIGLGPESVQVDDVVCVLGGTTMLHVLRSVSGKYQLIGDCFVDNLMDGEIVAALNAKVGLSGPVAVNEFLESTQKFLRKASEKGYTSSATAVEPQDLISMEASQASVAIRENILEVRPITIV
jgi:hypothetical protein